MIVYSFDGFLNLLLSWMNRSLRFLYIQATYFLLITLSFLSLFHVIYLSFFFGGGDQTDVPPSPFPKSCVSCVLCSPNVLFVCYPRCVVCAIYFYFHLILSNYILVFCLDSLSYFKSFPVF